MRPFPSVVLACALTLAAPVVLPAAADPAGPAPRAAAQRVTTPLSGTDDAPDGLVQGTRRPQTSDGVVGPEARDLQLLERGVSQRRSTTYRRIVPGVVLQTWDERDARGPIHASLLTVKYRMPGITVDYANNGPVQRTGTVRSILKRDHAVAGVNGDFYDIGRSGAPLGLGKSRRGGLYNGKLTGWNDAFSIGQGGWADISSLSTHMRVRQHPGLTITTVNSPRIPANSVGAYTPKWGQASGYLWTDGQRRNVRIAQVLDGRVVWTGSRLPVNRTWRGTLLIGRGTAAKQVGALKRGSRATVTTYVDNKPRMAITGNQFLVRDGIVRVIDDREMHPRTAIGIDRDTKTILLLTIDGRSSRSRGYTMVELADMMMLLGADEALNLDGGGSTTMVAKRASGGLGVVNRPSDGFERSVANAVSIRYRKPR